MFATFPIPFCFNGVPKIAGRYIGPKAIQAYHIICLNTAYMSFGVTRRSNLNFSDLVKVFFFFEDLLYAKQRVDVNGQVGGQGRWLNDQCPRFWQHVIRLETFNVQNLMKFTCNLHCNAQYSKKSTPAICLNPQPAKTLNRNCKKNSKIRIILQNLWKFRKVTLDYQNQKKFIA